MTFPHVLSLIRRQWRIFAGLVAVIALFCTFAVIPPVVSHAAPPQEYDSLLLYDGYRLYQDGQNEKAIAVFKDLLEKYPNSKLGDLALLWTAKAYLKLNKPTEAKTALLELQKKYPQSRLIPETNEQLAKLTGTAAEPAETAPAEAAPAEAAPQEAAVEDKAAAEKVAAEKAAAEKAAAEKVAAEKVAAEKVAAEKAAAEKAAAEKAAAEKAAAEKAAAEKAAAEKAAAEKAAAEKAAAEKAAAEKAAAEKVAAEKAAAEKAAAEKAAAEKVAAEKVAAEKVAAEKAAAEKAAAEKAAAEDRLKEMKPLPEVAVLPAIKAEEEKAAIAKDRLKEMKPLPEVAILPAVKAAEEEKAAAEKAAMEQKLAEERATAKKVAEEKAALAKQMAEEKAAAQKAAAEKEALTKKLAAEKAAAEKAAAERSAIEQKIAKESAAAQKAAEEKAVLDKKMAQEREAAEKAAAERAAMEQKLAEERSAAQKVAEEKAALAKQMAEEKAAAQKAAAEKEALTKKLAAEKAAAEKAAAERSAIEQKIAKESAAAQKAAEEKAALDKKMAQEREAAEKAAAEKTAMEQKLAEERATSKKVAEERAVLAKQMAEEKASAQKAAAEKEALTKKLAAERAAAEKAAAERAAMEQKIAKESAAAQKIAEEKAALEQKLAQQQAAAQKSAEEKAALKKKIAEEKAAAEKVAKDKAMEEKAARKQKLAEEKAAAEKVAAEKAALRQRQKAIENYRRVLREAPAGSEVAMKARARLQELGALEEAGLPPAPLAKEQKREVSRPAEVTIVPAAPGAAAEKEGEGFLMVTQAASVDVQPLRELVTTFPGEVAILPLRIINTGNAEDSFRLEALNLADFQASFFLDKIEDGELQPFEKQINVTPPIAPQKSVQVLLVLHTPPSLADGQVKEFEVRGVSLFNPGVSHVAKGKLAATAPVVRGNVVVSRGKVRPSDDLSYTVTYSNQGNALLQKGRLSLAFASDLMYSSATPAPVDVNLATNSVIWNVDDLRPSDQKSVTVTFRVKDNTPSSAVLHGTAQFEDTLLNKTIHFNAVSSEVEQVPSTVIKSHWSGRAAVPGDTLYLPYVITNTGNGPDAFTVAASGYDTGSVVIYADPNKDQFHQTDEPVMTETPVLLPGESYGALVELKVPVGKKDGHKMGVELKAKSKLDRKTESFAANEIGISLPIVATQTQLRIRDAAPGRLVAYQLTYENQGSGLARNLQITDQLPVELEFVDADPQPTKIENGTITWNIDELASRQKKSISVNVKIRSGIAAGRAIKKSTITSYRDLNGNVYR